MVLTGSLQNSTASGWAAWMVSTCWVRSPWVWLFWAVTVTVYPADLPISLTRSVQAGPATSLRYDTPTVLAPSVRPEKIPMRAPTSGPGIWDGNIQGLEYSAG